MLILYVVIALMASGKVKAESAGLIIDYAQDRFTLSTEVVFTNFEAIKRYVSCSDCLSCISRDALDVTTDLSVCASG